MKNSYRHLIKKNTFFFYIIPKSPLLPKTPLGNLTFWVKKRILSFHRKLVLTRENSCWVVEFIEEIHEQSVSILAKLHLLPLQPLIVKMIFFYWAYSWPIMLKKNFKLLASHQVPREFEPPTGITYGFLPWLISFSFRTFVKACMNEKGYWI